MQLTTDVLAAVAAAVCGQAVDVRFTEQYDGALGRAGIVGGKPAIDLDGYVVRHRATLTAGTFWHEVAHVACGHINRAQESEGEAAGQEALCNEFARRMEASGYGQAWVYEALRGYLPRQEITAASKAAQLQLATMAKDPTYTRAATGYGAPGAAAQHRSASGRQTATSAEIREHNVGVLVDWLRSGRLDAAELCNGNTLENMMLRSTGKTAAEICRMAGKPAPAGKEQPRRDVREVRVTHTDLQVIDNRPALRPQWR